MIAGDQISLGFVQQFCIRLKEATLKCDHEYSTGRQSSVYYGLISKIKQCGLNLNFTTTILYQLQNEIAGTKVQLFHTLAAGWAQKILVILKTNTYYVSVSSKLVEQLANYRNAKYCVD